MSMGPNSELTKGFIAGIVDSVKQRPFTELMALVTTLTLIALGYYELTIGRPELIQQIESVQEKAHDHFDANLDRILQAEDKRSDLFREMIEGQRDDVLGGNAAIDKPNHKVGAGT
jgi:sulfite exporter TauE/SafE